MTTVETEMQDTLLDLLNQGVIEIAGRADDGSPQFRVINESKLDALIEALEADE